MKKSSYFGIVFGAALLLTSCQQADVKMHTIVNKDGSCEREITYRTIMTQQERDSMMQGEGAVLAQPIPECLNMSAFMGTHTDIDGDTVTTTFSRPFHTLEDMCQETPLQLNGTRLKSKAHLEKHFRWFYTEYTFTEVFYCVGDTFKIAPTDYADKDVVSYWFTGQPNLVEGLSGAEASQKISEMEPFVNKWLNDNLYQTCFNFIVSHYDSIPNPPVSREQFVELHDSLANYLLKNQDDILNVDATKALRSFFHSDAYAIFFDEETPCGKEMNKQLSNCLNIFWFNVPYTLTMPGTVTNTGNGTLSPDGTVFYPFTGERLIPQDYTITATSRVTNVWAFIVTLLVIALAVATFFWRRNK